MGLYMPGLARRGIAVVRLRGVLTGASACRLTVPLRHAFAADPQLLVADLAGLRGWDDCGQRQLADIATYLAARGGQMVLSAMGAHLRCTEPRLASLTVFADVPAALAAGNGATWPPRLPRMPRRGPFRPGRGELLHHACQLMPARPSQVSAARRWAGAVLGSWDMPGHAGPAAAGLAELAANAAAFGFTATADITLRLWQAPDSTRWLTVTVHDSNPAPPVMRVPAPEGQGPRGWGLVFVTSFAHAHGWYPDACLGMPGKAVWFAHRVQPRTWPLPGANRRRAS